MSSTAGPETGVQARPTLAVVVNNEITGDSRVLKTALTASRAGWDVTLVGRAKGRVREESMLGPIRVVRVPLVRRMHDRFEQVQRGEHLATPGPEDLVSRGLRRLEGTASKLPRGSRYAVGATRRARRTLVARGLAGGAATPAAPAPTLPTVAPEDVAWRRDWPVLTDWWLSFGPEIVRMAPDLVHANDVMMLMVAARAASTLRLTGIDTAWVYDSHELVPAVDWGTPAVSAAYRQLEREYIGRADAVVTVSEDIARQIQQEYSLGTTPAVVANAPVQSVEPSGDSIRVAAGVPAGSPLMVYSGYVSPERGVDVAIEALALLPEVHLAIVANGVNPTLKGILERAEELGVRDRVHLAPYVPPFAVPGYLSSADLGLTPHHPDPNHHSSLPTKFAEYLHADLPIVASNMRTTSEFVQRTGVGTVFEASSPKALAEAVREVLDTLPQKRAAITGPIKEALSWERQGEVLLEVYTQVSGKRPQPPDEPVKWDVPELPIS